MASTSERSESLEKSRYIPLLPNKVEFSPCLWRGRKLGFRDEELIPEDRRLSFVKTLKATNLKSISHFDKEGSSKRLSEDISKLQFGRNVVNLNLPNLNFLPSKVVMHLNMLSPCMEY